MAHTFTYHMYHIVFGTKRRLKWILPEHEHTIHAYMAGIIRSQGGKTHIINGMEDHIHCLAEIKPSQSVADFIGKLKGGSSKWISETYPGMEEFKWQGGYSSFTVSRSGYLDVFQYIETQKEHHKNMTFKEEYLRLLEMHNIVFDPRANLDAD